MPSSTAWKAPSTPFSMESLNKELAAPFTAFLNTTIADDLRHMRFLNMISMMEHMGSRKIMLSQMRGLLTQDILKHLAEEARHAFFFKREAEKLAGTPIDGYPEHFTLCTGAARFYFERLDAGLTGGLAGKALRETRYLLVSYIIELRAIWVYHRYQDSLTAAQHPLSLKGVIAEEDRHLVDMESRLQEIGFPTLETLPGACTLEKGLFERFFGALTSAAR